MGITNVGSSVHIFSYKQALTSKSFNYLKYKVTNPGIYDGFAVSKINDSQVTIATGTFVIEDDTNKVSVKIKTETTISLSTSNIDYMLIFRMTWVDALNNYVDCLAVEPSEVLSTDVVIGKLSYSGSTLTAVDYSYRTFGNSYKEKTLLDHLVSVLYINPGTNFWYINGWTIVHINEKIKTNYVTLTTTGDYYLVYNGTTYAVEADTVVMSFSTTKNGFYDTNGYKVLAHFNYSSVTQKIGIIEIYDNNYPTMDDLKKYLDSAKKQKMAYSSGNLSTVTYYNHITTETLGTTMAIETFSYTGGVLTTSTLALYNPIGTLWKTYNYSYTYVDGSLISVTYVIA